MERTRKTLKRAKQKVTKTKEAAQRKMKERYYRGKLNSIEKFHGKPGGGKEFVNSKIKTFLNNTSDTSYIIIKARIKEVPKDQFIIIPKFIHGIYFKVDYKKSSNNSSTNRKKKSYDMYLPSSFIIPNYKISIDIDCGGLFAYTTKGSRNIGILSSNQRDVFFNLSKTKRLIHLTKNNFLPQYYTGITEAQVLEIGEQDEAPAKADFETDYQELHTARPLDDMGLVQHFRDYPDDDIEDDQLLTVNPEEVYDEEDIPFASDAVFDDYDIPEATTFQKASKGEGIGKLHKIFGEGCYLYDILNDIKNNKDNFFYRITLNKKLIINLTIDIGEYNDTKDHPCYKKYGHEKVEKDIFGNLKFNHCIFNFFSEYFTFTPRWLLSEVTPTLYPIQDHLGYIKENPMYLVELLKFLEESQIDKYKFPRSVTRNFKDKMRQIIDSWDDDKDIFSVELDNIDLKLFCNLLTETLIKKSPCIELSDEEKEGKCKQQIEGYDNYGLYSQYFNDPYSVKQKNKHLSIVDKMDRLKDLYERYPHNIKDQKRHKIIDKIYDLENIGTTRLKEKYKTNYL